MDAPMTALTHIPSPIVSQIECWDYVDGSFSPSNVSDLREQDYRYIFSFPMVYIVYTGNDNVHTGHIDYLAYVGETTDIAARTRQHFIEDPKSRKDWQSFAEQAAKDHGSVNEFVIGHPHFNKSLTLDVENRLMHYLSGVDSIKYLYNRRTNPQGDYYTREELDELFSKIWGKLHTKKPDLFPLESAIKDSAVFKASPFHQLSSEQLEAEDAIVSLVRASFADEPAEADGQDGTFGKLIVVQGAAGTGKTVLISHLFYRLCRDSDGEGALSPADVYANTSDDVPQNAYILIKHAEQRHVYNQIAKKLGLQARSGEIVLNPTSYINRFSKKKIDANGRPTSRPDVGKPQGRAKIALVDEAHLLLTQGNQGYSGKNMLLDIMRRTEVTIAVFDPGQILQSSQQWKAEDLKALLGTGHSSGSAFEEATLSGGEKFERASITLHKQFRIVASDPTIAWIDSLAMGGEIGQIPADPIYDLKVFDSPVELFLAIKEKAEGDGGRGLSRVLATYDWDYKDASKDKNDLDGYWAVSLHMNDSGTWEMGRDGGDEKGFSPEDDCCGSRRFYHPWNYCLVPRGGSELEKETAWAEKPATINEIGSTYTIQGFDLNYAGVIIGPSVKFRDGKIVFDGSASKNTGATNLRSGSTDYSQANLRNELNVLLKRGVHGLYLFAVDPGLQAELLRSQQGTS